MTRNCCRLNRVWCNLDRTTGSADAADAAGRSGDRPAADWHGADQLPPPRQAIGAKNALTAGQPDDAQKHDETSAAGQALAGHPRIEQEIPSTGITDHEFADGAFQTA